MFKPINCDIKTNELRSERVGDNNLELRSDNTTQRQAESAVILQVNNTALVQRSAENHSDYIYSLLNEDSIYNVLTILSSSEIKVAREVCKAWQEIIDGISIGGHSILQQRFIIKMYLSNLDHESCIIKKGLWFKFCFMRDSSTSAKETNGLLQCIAEKDPCYIMEMNPILNNIEMLSFKDIELKNYTAVQNLLNTIFENEERFSGLKTLKFGFIERFTTLVIPDFKHLELLIVEEVVGNLIIECSGLKKLKLGTQRKGSDAPYNSSLGFEAPFRFPKELKNLTSLSIFGILSANAVIIWPNELPSLHELHYDRVQNNMLKIPEALKVTMAKNNFSSLHPKT